MEKNLIEKLAGKWADFKFAVSRSKIAKRVATIMLAGAMAVPVVLSASACHVTIEDNGDGTYDINPVDPNPGDNTGTQQGGNTGNQQGGNQQGGSTQKPAPDYSKYSPLLQSVLTDPSYDELYSKYESGEISESGTTLDSGLNIMEAIPYNYISSKGEDIEGIKNGTVGVDADLYTMENDINHIYNRLEVIYRVNNNEKYINQYLLKYEISEQELKDLTMLYNGKYYQGPVMFQKLAKIREPKVISEFSLTESAYKNILNSSNNKNNYIAGALNYNKMTSLSIISFIPTTYKNKEAYDATMYLFGEMGTGPVTSCELYEVNAKLVDFMSKVTYNNGVMDLYDLNALEPNLISSTPITYFQLDHAFKNVKTNLN